VSIVVDLGVHIIVTPNIVTVAAGATQAFSAAAYDSLDNLVSGLTFAWTTNVGTMVGSDLVAQLGAGVAGYVRASYGSAYADAFVTIVPGSLDHIDLSPSSLNAIAGSQTQFTAVGKDLYNNPISGLTFSWSTTVGSVDASGLFTAQTVAGASGTVSAASGLITGTASVTVTVDQLTHIIVTPSVLSIVAGTTQTFSAAGYDQFSNAIPGLVFTWTTNIGTMTGATLTAQPLSGVAGYVGARVSLVVGYAFVTVVSGALTHIDMSPSLLNMVASSQALFAATGKDVYNNPVPGLTYSWTTTVGTIDSAGLFTAQAIGGVSGYVNATSGAIKGSAIVNLVSINGPPLVMPLPNMNATVSVPVTVSGVAMDPDGDPLRYTWDFGDGSHLVVGQTATHTYTAVGTYTYRLYVDDLTGIPGHNVSVSATMNLPTGMQISLGWNFVSIPVVGDNRASTLGLLMGDTVVGWNPATQSYDETFIIGITPQSMDFDLEASEGYWVYASGARTLIVSGSPPTDHQSRIVNVPSSGGWVAIGITSQTAGFTAGDLASMFSGGRVIIVVGWMASKQTYYSHVIGFPMNDFALLPGQGYWMYVTGPGVLSYNP
jgi:hypothetical protein